MQPSDEGMPACPIPGLRNWLIDPGRPRSERVPREPAFGPRATARIPHGPNTHRTDLASSGPWGIMGRVSSMSNISDNP